MEVSFLKEPANSLAKKPILDSNSNRLPITSRAGNIVLAEQESDKCNHFTIRDYVSEVRKKNAKICLPFPMLDQLSGDHVNALPPLEVKRFRRWDCRRCAREIIALESVIPNGANMTSQSNGSKNCDNLLVGDATNEAAKSSARSQQQAESSVLIKGTILSKVCYHRSEDDHNQTSKPNAEACQAREKEGTIRASSSRIALLSEDNPKILSSKRDKTVLVHLNEISDKEEDQGLSKISKKKELGSHVDPKNGALPSSPDHMWHHYSKNLDGCSDGESDSSIHFIHARKPGVSVEKSCPRRSCKIRTLDNIMKSAALRKVDKNCIFSENTGASGRGSIQISDASKDNDEHPKHKGHLIKDKEPTSIKRKNKEAVPNNGEGTCLIHWLKNVTKKARLHKGELEGKDINTAASTSKCASSKGVHLNLEYSATGEIKKEIIRKKKRNMMPGVEVVKSSFTPQKESIVQKGHIISEDLKAKNLHSRSPGIIMSEKDLRHKLETIENNYKKALLGNKKNKTPLIEDEASSQTQWFKDFLGEQKQAFVQTQREVKKKQRTMQMPEQEAVDDIPMDIVEHLAKKQHEKYLMNTKDGSSNLSKLPEAIENVKDLNGCDNAGFDARISTINSEDTESRSKSKQCHFFDLNQEAPACASTELQSPSPYIGLSMSGAQLSIIESNRNYFPQNLSAVGMKTQPFRSDHRNHTVLPQNLFGNAHDGGSFGLLNGYPSHINSQNISSSLLYPSPESRNGCYSNIMMPVDLQNNETMFASNFLWNINQSAHSGEPRLSLLRNGYTNTFNSHSNEFLLSELNDKHGGNMCKPLRPLPRIGILGPLLQKEISNTSNNIRPILGFGANSQLSLHNASFVASNPKSLTSHKTTEKVMNAQTSKSRNECSKRLDNNGQIATNSRNGAFQPLKSTHKMEECVLNRNPADFAMVDEGSEYMIGYKEAKAKDRMPHSGKLQPQTHIRGQKGQKMRKLCEIKRSRKSNKVSPRGKV